MVVRLPYRPLGFRCVTTRDFAATTGSNPPTPFPNTFLCLSGIPPAPMAHATYYNSDERLSFCGTDRKSSPPITATNESTKIYPPHR